MANPAVLLSRLGFAGFGKETTQGTAVAATFYPQLETIKGEFVPEYIDDDSIAASAGKIRGVYQGQYDSTFEVGGFCYPDTIGNFLVAAGFADSVTGSSSPWTHTFKMPAAGTQPPSYTITWQTGENGASSVAYPGCTLDTLDFTIDNKGAIKYSAKFKGWAPVSFAKPTPTFGSINPFINYQVLGSVGGASSATLLKASVNIKRNTEAIHTAQQVQNPYLVFGKEYEAGVKAQFVMLDRTLWNHVLTNDQPSISFSASSSSTAVFTITNSVGAWRKAPVIQDKNSYLKVGDIDIECITNATDVGPMAFTLVNTASSAY